MLQLPPAAIVPLQFEVPSEKSFELKPPKATLVTCSAALPLLERTMFCGAAEVPCVVVPGRLKGLDTLNETTAAGGGGWLAFPESEMACGLLGESPVMTMAATLG